MPAKDYHLINMTKSTENAINDGRSKFSGGVVYKLDWVWRVVLPVTILTLFGAALDDKMASAPWFMLIGALLGLLLSIFLLRQLELSRVRAG